MEARFGRFVGVLLLLAIFGALFEVIFAYDIVDDGSMNRVRICGPDGGCSIAGEYIGGKIKLSRDGSFLSAEEVKDPGMGGINAPGEVYVGERLGVGITSPQAKLDVAGNSKFKVGFSSYTPHGVWDEENALYSSFSTPHGSEVRIGYADVGGGQYFASLGFALPSQHSSSADSLPVIQTRFNHGTNPESANRFNLYPSGKLSWGDGSSGHDTELSRVGKGVLRANSNFIVAKNLGVGVVNPSSRLHVSSDVNDWMARFEQKHDSGYGLLLTVPVINNANVIQANAGGNTIFAVRNDGNLYAEGSVVSEFGNFVGDGNYARLMLRDSVGSDLMYGEGNRIRIDSSSINYVLGGDSKMYVNSEGNVGVGTISPDAKLEVAGGDLKVEKNIVSDGQICIGKCD